MRLLTIRTGLFLSLRANCSYAVREPADEIDLSEHPETVLVRFDNDSTPVSEKSSVTAGTASTSPLPT